jgi:hypothetical protein
MVLVNAWFVITLSCLTTFHFTLCLLPPCQLLVLGNFYSHLKLLPKSRHEQTRKKLEIGVKSHVSRWFFHKIVDSDFKLFLVGTKKHGRAKRANTLLMESTGFFSLFIFLLFNLFLVCLRIPSPSLSISFSHFLIAFKSLALIF